MEKKKTSFIIAAILVIIVVVVIYLLAASLNKKNEVSEIIEAPSNSQLENNVIPSVNEDGMELNENAGIKPATDWMNDEEKDAAGLSDFNYVQVLERNNDGSIVSFRIVADDIVMEDENGYYIDEELIVE